MIRQISIAAAVIAAVLNSCKNPDSFDDNVLWYDTPAGKWEEALPVGNGTMGAMVFGNTGRERIQFNENTLYSGEPQPSLGIDIAEDLAKVRKLLSEGKNADAEAIMQKKWIGRLNEAYQPFGDVRIDFGDSSGISGYRHSLDMRTGTVTTSYLHNGTRITRKIFASHPDQAIVIRLEAEKPVLEFSASLTSEHPFTADTDDCSLTIRGQAPAHAQRRDIANMRKFGTERLHPEYFDAKGNVIRDKHIIYGDELEGKGTYFESQLLVHNFDGGEISVENGTIKAEGCRAVTLLLYAATSFNGPDKSPSREGRDPHAIIASRKKELRKDASFRTIYETHVQDFSSLYDRVTFRMPSTKEQKKLPTDARLKMCGEKEDPGLVAQLFQFGRYLMISGSREGGQPLNLQGLWNDKVLPPWNSGYTLNINLEMNYWPAEVCNLSECHEPLFRLIGEIADRGKAIARDMYGLDGWVIHHNISQWREGYPSDGFVYWFFWNMSGPWLCSHIWEHYLFSEDTAFLKENYPILKESAEFFCGWLVENSEGKLVTPVSTSPENAYLLPDGTPASICEGSTMDMAIVRNLFENTVKASEILGVDPVFRNELESRLERLQGYRTGSKGQILEWDREYVESEPQHRHLSHLFGLYPGHEISEATPELFAAARKSLELRGNFGTGWSIAWKIPLWARLKDGEKAAEALHNLMKYSGPDGKESDGAGLYRNLLNANPFQIDGNFGATAGIAEMLLQSDGNTIRLLPAIPASWKKGNITGLKARGGMTVDIRWKDGKVTAILESGKDRTTEIICGDMKSTVKTEAGEKTEIKFNRCF